MVLCQVCKKKKATHINEDCPYAKDIHGTSAKINVCSDCWTERIQDI